VPLFQQFANTFDRPMQFSRPKTKHWSFVLWRRCGRQLRRTLSNVWMSSYLTW